MSRIDSTRFIGADTVRDEDILLDNNQSLRGRNAANNADIDLLKVDASDNTTLMSSANINLTGARINAASATGPFRYPVLSSDPGSPLSGDIYYNSTTNIIRHYDGSNWHDVPEVDPVFTGGYMEDFLSGGTTTATFNNTSAGTGANISNSGSSVAGNVWGVLGCATGTTTVGRGSGRGGVVNFSSTGRGYMVAKMRTSFVNLSDGTDTYAFDIGFHDQYTTSSTPTEGIYFYYDSTISANWIVRNTNASTTTSTTTSVPVTTAFQTLSFVVNAAWTSIEFFVDGVSVATHTTNIPDGTSNLTSGVRIIKSVGTNSRVALTDYIYFRSTFGTPRG
jgi:hypothetical protein